MDRDEKSRFAVAVLSGGDVLRSGEDRAQLQLAGKPLIPHVLQHVRPLGAPVFVVTDRPEQYSHFNADVVVDVVRGKGLLGGILSALQHSPAPYTLCVASDMPFLNRALLDYLLSLRAGFDAVVPMVDDQPQGLHAIYHQRCVPVMRHFIDRNQLRVSGLFEHLRVRLVSETAIRAIDRDLRSFTNLNTPEELARARRELGESVPPDTSTSDYIIP
ncbi:MAG: molybdenum cofactor guanylyltransferase [Chloroflexi bacterium]|nr:molybdenum cofactor guanylyltransferase [Chloroflexota bacterium]